MAVQTLPFSSLLNIDKKSGTAIYRQLADALIDLIRDSKLKPGYQLPSSRAMALILSLNRTTIVAAYEELKIQGWLEVIERKGIFVSNKLPVVKPTPFQKEEPEKSFPEAEHYFYHRFSEIPRGSRELKAYQLLINDGYPDQRIAPFDMIFNRYKTLIRRTYLHGTLLTEQAAGNSFLRKELADFMSKTRALDIAPENILITQGAQLAIFIAARMILRPGSTVVVADLNYILANRLFEELGAKLIKVRIDDDGIDVDAIEEICRTQQPDLLYLIPHHHHPTTVTLSGERRIKLLDVIRRYKLPVIEDDYDYDFHYENSPILPLASAAHGGYVLYIGSISKTLSPTVRLGYLVGSNDFIWQAAKLKQMVDIRGDVLFEESIAHLFNSGEMQKHLRRSVELYKYRRDLFCDALQIAASDIVTFERPKGGMAVWAVFPKEYSVTLLAERMAGKGAFLSDGSIYPYNSRINGVRLGFASLNPSEIAQFMQTLKDSL
ncbi:PLP-dependent aminotransferase family protein [Mucilaginibacter pallidiroseus]|uniref:PLP-dependent aminotransferase family protein n=1 Tax=Mucilaginibacter pallidiroseus TaxID=2599295 RepID=A0A563TYI6_9SPHI|nr:PLP-dependent aminotransferase family protein [Mucilaginibacter pallidiroseus]TWR24425.1 PLP-dependent aminotransferase family protein [Mucilaginibacter pallidiroseus]